MDVIFSLQSYIVEFKVKIKKTATPLSKRVKDKQVYKECVNVWKKELVSEIETYLINNIGCIAETIAEALRNTIEIISIFKLLELGKALDLNDRHWLEQ